MNPHKPISEDSLTVFSRDLAVLATKYKWTKKEISDVQAILHSQLLSLLTKVITDGKPERRINENKKGFGAASISHGYKNTPSDYFDEGFNGACDIYQSNMLKMIGGDGEDS